LSRKIELWAYIVAKHYNISLHEVYQMPKNIFTQSLTWALAMNDEREKNRSRNKAKSKSGEMVPLDYSFLDKEDF